MTEPREETPLNGAVRPRAPAWQVSRSTAWAYGLPIGYRSESGDAVGDAWEVFTTPARPDLSARERRAVDASQEIELEYTGRRLDAGTALAVYAWGEGPTVLLAHGWGGRGAQMSAFVEPLVARGLRAVAFDCPAHGRSAGARSNIYEFATTLQNVAALVGSVHGIIGHSLGGATTMMALSRGLCAERAAIIAPIGRLYEEVGRFATHARLAPEVEAGLRRLMEGYFNPDIWRKTSLPDISHLVPAEVLTVHDENDPQVPYSSSVEFASLCPNRALYTTRGLGHFAPLRTRKVVHDIVDFVAEGARAR